MRTVHQGVRLGLVAQVAVLVVLAGAGAVGVVGSVAGGCFVAALLGLLARALRRAGAGAMGPADLVTLGRAVLVGGVAALVAESVTGPVPVVALTGLAAVALLLDGVDGRVARSTGTASAVGARFDMEVDSALVLLLSVYVADRLGAWVVAIGSAHYVLVLARRGLPWLQASLPPRYWCKVVAVVQGVALLVCATGALPHPVGVAALAVVGALLTESFGREVWLLWRGARGGSAAPVGLAAVGSARA